MKKKKGIVQHRFERWPRLWTSSPAADIFPQRHTIAFSFLSFLKAKRKGCCKHVLSYSIGVVVDRSHSQSSLSRTTLTTPLYTFSLFFFICFPSTGQRHLDSIRQLQPRMAPADFPSSNPVMALSVMRDLFRIGWEFVAIGTGRLISSWARLAGQSRAEQTSAAAVHTWLPSMIPGESNRAFKWITDYILLLLFFLSFSLFPCVSV